VGKSFLVQLQHIEAALVWRMIAALRRNTVLASCHDRAIAMASATGITRDR